MVDPGTNAGRAARAGALTTVAIAISVLAGWCFQIDTLKSILPGTVTMNPATALGMVLAGTALALVLLDRKGRAPGVEIRLRWAARGCALGVALIGLTKLSGLFWGWGIGVDQWLFATEVAKQLPLPSRIAPNTALNLFLVGGALLVIDLPHRLVRLFVEISVFVVVVGSLLAVLGYAYRIHAFYGLGDFIPMSLPTAITFSILSGAMVLSHTDRGWLAILVSAGAGGIMARRLLPAAILVPAGLGWLMLKGEEEGIYHGEFGEAVFVVGNILVFTFLVYLGARGLSRAEAARHKAEATLKESELRYRSLFDNMLEGYAYCRILYEGDQARDYVYLEVNAAFTTLTGLEDVIGKKVSEVIPGAMESNPELIEIYSRVAATGRPEKHEFYRQSLGRWFAVSVYSHEPEHFVAVFDNITERKKTEGRFHRLVDSNIQGVIFWNTNGEISEANEAFLNLLHYTGEDLAARRIHWTALTPPEFVEADRRALEEIAAKGACRPYEKEFWRKDGVRVPVLVGAAVYADNPNEGVCFVLDQTERRKAEETLRTSEERFRFIVDAVQDYALLMLDPDGLVVSWNAGAERIKGYRAEEIIGRHFSRFYLPESVAEGHPAEELRIAAKEGRFVEEGWRLRKDGSRFLADVVITAIRDETGRLRGFAKVTRDITERKRLEDQLFQSQKLETVGKLAGGIAHEFNSILTAIIGQSELLLGDLPAGSPLATNASEINQAALRAATLTRQLLAYGRKQLLQPEVLNLNTVLAGMEGTLRHLMGRDTDVRLAGAAGLNLVKADAGQIEQVILNLAVNAREAMPRGGKLTLETANVTLDGAAIRRYPDLTPGDYVMLAVTDNGAGMSAEVKARLFEPFYSTKEVGQGTGLGLSTCYGIIKQSGGHIGVYSEPGRGSIFKVYLPQAAPQTMGPRARPPSPTLPRGTETVLLAEDDPALREMAATLLGRLGYTVLTAADGLQALQVLQQRGTGHVDVLFTNIVMPHMSGKELSERMQALSPHTRILFTSAYTENAILHQGMLNEGAALLQKPFTPSALAHKLRDVLDHPPPLR